MSIAEKLREAAARKAICSNVDHIALALASASAKCDGDCSECIERWYGRLADAIEAEQTKAVAKALIAEIAKPETISVGLLRGVAIDLEDMARLLSGAHAEDLSHCAGLIRKAIDKPDTQEAIDADCMMDAKDYCEKHGIKTEWPKHHGKAKCEHLLARQRKLLGGE